LFFFGKNVMQENTIKTQHFKYEVVSFIEGPLFDRKAMLPKVYRTAEECAEFIKDVISLANSARRRGQPAYLLFGVQDDGTITGIEGQFLQKDSPSRDWATSSSEKQQERIQRELLSLIKKHLGGDPGISYEWGYIDQMLVSYLVFPGRTPPQWIDKPYEVIQAVKVDKQVYLEVGKCYVRVGESKVEVPPHERGSLHSYNQIPFVDPKQWRGYLNSIASLEVLAPLSIYCTIDDMEGDALLADVLRSRVGNLKRRDRAGGHCILVTNQPGCGKTTASRKLCQVLAEQALLSLDEQLYEPPNEPIPILIPLQDFSYKHGDLMQNALRHLEGGGVDFKEWPVSKERLFDDRALVFVIILDGYDEMSMDDWDENRRAFDAFVSRVARHVVVISCRSTRVDQLLNPNRQTYSNVVAHLSVQNCRTDEVGNYLKSITTEHQFIEELVSEMGDIILRPLVLEVIQAFLSRVEEVRSIDNKFQSPTLTEVLHSVLPDILANEIAKFNPLNHADLNITQQYIHPALAELAWQQVQKHMNETPLSDLPQTLQSGQVPQWLTWTGLLRSSRIGFGFTSELVRDYFALQYLLSLNDLEVRHNLALLAPLRVQEMLHESERGGE
jgi:hypothetical protein